MSFFRQWHTGNIHRHTLIVSLVPAILMAGLLSSYFTFARFQDLQQGLFATGQLLAEQLAPAAEYGVITGNHHVLQGLLESARHTEHVRCINIYNQDDQKVASISNQCPPASRTFKFEALIKQQSIPLPNTFLAQESTTEQDKTVIGRVVVVMSNNKLRKQQQQSLMRSGMLSGFAFLLTLLLAHTLSRSLSRPLHRMSQSLKGLQDGKYQPINTKHYSGEIAELAGNINRLSEDLAQARQDQQVQLLQASKALENAEHANRSKSDFLAMMSHELRTPMNGVLGMLQLLETTEQTNEQQEYTAFASYSGKQLLQVINNILDLSRLEHNALEFELLPFNLKQLLDTEFKHFELEAKQRELDFRVNYSNQLLNSTLLGDPTRIKQILLNLVSNALKFTEHGFVKVSCEAFPIDATHLELAIKVSDSGIGIAKNRIDYMFDAFSQADSSISRRYGGTGLGLSISQRLAVQMGGTLTCTSQEGIGSLFMLKIPIAITTKKNN